MYTLDASRIRPSAEFKLSDRFFGSNDRGGSIGFTNQSMLVNGRPFFGISGEVHFCRVSPDQWEDTLLKAKCGGINIIATYVFWNVHEEVEGRFRFDGCRDLRRFVTLCQEHGLMVILRIGPFDHGEMRNGGLPDWLYGKPFEVRGNNQGYLACVRRWFQALHEQVDGLYFGQNGPIVGIQLENEYMHSSAPWEITTGIAGEWVNGGQDGEEHIRALKAMAQEIGMIAPFYTCTAWGGGMAPVDEVLPLWGGYAYWPWIFYNRTGEHPCTPEYIYRDNHNNAVPQTYNFEPRYAPESMPYACCEMMGGMMCSYNYRFTLPYESVDALANIKLGSGCAMLGYYMYRGGTTPTGERTPFLNESQVSKRSYDYQAPIGEFGQRRASYDRLRTLHDFCTSFADRLLGSVTVLPDAHDAMQPEDRETLRCCARIKDNSGFLFLNNFQDHLAMPPRVDEQVAVVLPEETIRFSISLASGENAILPIRQPMGSVMLKAATVQPVTCLHIDGHRCWFFMIPEGMKPMMDFGIFVKQLPEDALSDFMVGDERVIVMPRKTAMRFSHIVKDGRDIAILSDSCVIWDGASARLELCGMPQQIMTMPAMKDADIQDGPFGGRIITANRCGDIPLALEQVGPYRWTITVDTAQLTGHKTVLLRMRYMGSIGQAFINGEMISDNFCNGQPWDVRLDPYAEQLKTHPLTIYIVPVKKGATVSVDSTMAARMEHVEGIIADLDGMDMIVTDDAYIDLD